MFRQKNSNRIIVARQYDELTDAARQFMFYQDMNVPDTVMGRFNMVCIHMILYLRVVRNQDQSVQSLAQDIIDAFFEDIDHSIRELGIGDAGVPKRMKKLASMFYGRANAYDKALDNHDKQALVTALERNFYPRERNEKKREHFYTSPDLNPLADMNPLAHYIISTNMAIQGYDHNCLLEGRLTIPRL